MAKFIPEFLESKGNPLADKARVYLEEEKLRLVTEARDNLEKDRAKKKKNLPADITEDDYVPRLTEDMLYEILRHRLNLSDCLNRGYILDGYPRSVADANEIFVIRTEIPAVKPEDPEAEVPESTWKEDLRVKIMPQCVLDLSAPEEYIKAQLTKNMPAEILAASNLNEEAWSRRLPAWKFSNVFDEKLKNKVFLDFWKKWRFDIVTANVESMPEEEIISKTCEATDKEIAEYEPVTFCQIKIK
jgi:adenylate kinase family enzyme